MGNEGQTMQGLISSLKAQRIITSQRVEEVMSKVDRSHYCQSLRPYEDTPCPIKFGATISAPHMHAHALEVLSDKLVEGAKALDVGSGSGYLTACMAHMVGPTGLVYGVEHIRELVEDSKRNIRQDCAELLDSGRVQIFQADGRAGLEQFAPFDVIHVGASADGLPEKLIEQLKEGGRMVLPLAKPNKCYQSFEKLDKLPGGKIERAHLLNVNYVPLTDSKYQLGR